MTTQTASPPRLFSTLRTLQQQGSSRQLIRLSSWIGMILLTLLLTLAVIPNIIAPYDSTERVALPLQKPNEENILGTNDLGQDLFSELIAGTRASLFTGLIVSFISVLFGVLVGLISGYLGGWADSLLMRLTDLILVLPFLPLVILLSVYLGPSQRNVIIVLALFFWAGPARLIRAQVLHLREDTYIEAARALGANSLQIMTGHLWSGVRPLVLAQIVLVASASILAESSLSFLGLGDPSGKSWGTMLYFARASGAFLSDAWKWWVLPTGLMITLTVLSLGLIGYSLEQRISNSVS
ncbi:MAG: ABC transporter permease [Anaerolineae bacterium]|nr:ABC transporter permease [Anaerolineae bacterium]MCI0608832.1 ABC transporter permease [Anaerolineae bacterium]